MRISKRENTLNITADDPTFSAFFAFQFLFAHHFVSNRNSYLSYRFCMYHRSLRPGTLLNAALKKSTIISEG